MNLLGYIPTVLFTTIKSLIRIPSDQYLSTGIIVNFTGSEVAILLAIIAILNEKRYVPPFVNSIAAFL
jgi:hypothetical protein